MATNASPGRTARLSIANEGKDKKTRHTFTDAELIAIVQACRAADSRSKGGVPDAPRLLMAMLVDTGARIAELAGLPMSDLRLGAPVPHVVLQTHPWRSIKTGESRTIRFTPRKPLPAAPVFTGYDLKSCQGNG